jgi:hypothetical protein
MGLGINTLEKEQSHGFYQDVAGWLCCMMMPSPYLHVSSSSLSKESIVIHRPSIFHNLACSALDSTLRSGPLRLPSLQTKGVLSPPGSVFNLHFSLTTGEALSSKQSAIYRPRTGRNLKPLRHESADHMKPNTKSLTVLRLLRR